MTLREMVFADKVKYEAGLKIVQEESTIRRKKEATDFLKQKLKDWFGIDDAVTSPTLETEGLVFNAKEYGNKLIIDVDKYCERCGILLYKEYFVKHPRDLINLMAYQDHPCADK